MIQAALAELLEGRDLSREQAREVMDEIMRGEATQAQAGGFLIALRLKGESADEIAGCAEAMRDHVLPVRAQRDDLVDTCGTGGDGASTINISTAAAIVAAAAGAGVAKHGNRAVSSASGSADVLEALGFQLEQPPERIAQSIDELGFGFMFAPAHHPAMRHAAPVRRELAARTVFNVLGAVNEPRRRPRAGDRRLRPDAGTDARRGARPARLAARVRRPRRARHRRALAAGPNDGCEVVDGEVRDAWSTRSSSGSSAATRLRCAAALRPRTPPRSARSSPARTAAAATRSC